MDLKAEKHMPEAAARNIAYCCRLPVQCCPVLCGICDPPCLHAVAKNF